MKQKQTEQTNFVYGMHASCETLESKTDINKVWVQDGINPKNKQKILQLAQKRKLVVQFSPKSKLDELVDGANHQGVVLAIAAYEYANFDDLLNIDDGFLLILDSIEDPHNLGSILRTADACGCAGVIIPKRRAVQLTSTVAKISTGAIEHVPVARVTNLVNAVQELKKAGFWIFGTDMKGTDYSDWNADGKVAIVIGNEGKGISPLLKKQVDDMLTIPMIGHVQSLNASVAASLLMYQAFNKKRKHN